jgi:hypothetical protein
MLDKNAVLNIAKKLDLPPEQYLIFAGGSLATHGIRETGDVDMVVTPELFASLKESGVWKHSTRWEDNIEFLARGDVEIASKLEWDEYPVTLVEAKSREDIIDGIPFMSLKDIIQFKQAYGRKKDQRDIMLIKEYLEANG